MKPIISLFFILSIALISCNSNKSANEENKVKASQRVTLDDKGVGPVYALELPDEINTAMAAEGKILYENNCVACHKATESFIGPSPSGILSRRSPEWIMNMILRPDVMVHENEVAKELMEEYDLTPMANLNLTEEQARAILEYFRTID